MQQMYQPSSSQISNSSETGETLDLGLPYDSQPTTPSCTTPLESFHFPRHKRSNISTSTCNGQFGSIKSP